MAQDQEASGRGAGRPKWFGYAQLALILAAIGVALYFAQAPRQVERQAVSDMALEQGMPSVTVIKPSATEEALTVAVTGTVTLEGKAKITSEVGGRVAWISPEFRNGGAVYADEPFIRIDAAEYELRVEEAQMAVREAEARVSMKKARAEEGAAAYARENPGAEIPDRVRRLPAIAKAEAELGSAQTALKLALLQLERTSISLPYDGRVIASDVEVGEFVGPAELVGGGAAVLGSVYRTGALQVRAPVEVDDLAYLAPAIGRTATVSTPAGTFEASVARTSSVVAPKTRLARMFLKFADGQAPDTLPLPGTFVEVSLTGPVHENVFVLPEAALQDRGRVWIVDGGVLKAVQPRMLGHADAGWVMEAFDAGDGVVLGAVPGARDGLAVEASDAAPAE